MRIGPNNNSNPSGTIRKKFFLCKSKKQSAICAILREKTPFLAFPEAKKGVVNCTRLRKAAHWPNNNANPSGLSEKKVYCVESSRFVRSLGKKPHFWPSQRRKRVVVNFARLRKAAQWPNNNANPSGLSEKKGLLCRKARCVRSLGKKPHFWPSHRRKKALLTSQGCARLRTGPIIMQIPRGYQKKKFIV